MVYGKAKLVKAIIKKIINISMKNERIIFVLLNKLIMGTWKIQKNFTNTNIYIYIYYK